jgi:D-sedoheptulose 7-phosphate isomerase
MTTVLGYMEGVKTLIDQIVPAQVERLTDLLLDAWKQDRRVLLIGNGGSAGTASHIVNDLQKCIHLESGRPLKALCLSDCTPLIMAWANDTEYANIFAPQVECWAEPGDLVIAISGSGNSPNIIRAVEKANSLGAFTIGLAGFAGGKLANAAKEVIVVRSENMQQIEDIHMILLHLVFSLLRDRVAVNS